MKVQGYYKPQTIEQALALMEKLENARFIAGGTDLMVLLKKKMISPENLISLRNIRCLDGVEKSNYLSRGFRIGSITTHNNIAKNVLIRNSYGALHDAASRIGSQQIRNVATIGGNICNASPSADTACPLLVLDGKLLIVNNNGKRLVDIDDFFLGPNRTILEKNEIIKEFHLPCFNGNNGSAYTKISRRQSMDVSIVGIAVRISIVKEGDEFKCEDVRIAMSAVAPRPIRAKKAEAFLKGKTITPELTQETGEIAASEATPIDTFRGQAWYSKDMIKIVTKETINRAMEQAVKQHSCCI